MKYKLILAQLYDRPWCILESKLSTIAALIQSRASESEEEVARQLQEWRESQPEAKAQRRDAAAVASVGIVPILGTMARRANMVSDYSGGTSTQMAAQNVDQMAADPNIAGILLDIDSPGGTYDGTPELAAAVARAAKQKPVFASANGMAASAAYWVGSQATEFAAAPSADVGSVGVIMAHMDESQAFAKLGVKPTLIRAGQNKQEGNQFEPLTDGVRERLQAVVDEIGREFIRAVAEGRGVSQAKVRDAFGEGRVFLAREAKDRGMVDRVEPVEETLSRLLRRVSRSGSEGGARAQIETIRDFEAFLRDEGGFSHSAAKRIAAGGFKQEEPPREEASVAPEVLSGLSEFVKQLKTQPRGGQNA